MSEVVLAIEGAVARITLDRPPLNVLSTSTMLDLASALASAGSRSEVRVVRLDARGKAFCAGVDVADHVGDALHAMMRALGDLFAAFERVPQPVVAVVEGAALGGGLELVLGCDLCVAAERARFGQPEIKLGVFAPPASVLLPRIVGERKAAEMLFLGESVDAREAARLGLVNAVFPDLSFEHDAAEWVGKLAALSGSALRLAKRAVVTARGLPAREAHEALHRIYMDELMRTADAEEGLRSFLEKRPPSWSHR